MMDTIFEDEELDTRREMKVINATWEAAQSRKATNNTPAELLASESNPTNPAKATMQNTPVEANPNTKFPSQ